ncbi:hypothetical protein DENSPDRAFT_784045 [Dentipellis sp. KUC8613]|nr:hypothetical protein DENSPDRAFT_784045 [Dentipellis sp. KUC8613]
MDVLCRVALFLFCRRLLLGSLYEELTDVSSSTPNGEYVELDALPPPNSATSASGRLPPSKRSLQSVLSRTLFCICFSESCTLFLILMCQGMGVFHPQTRLFNWRISLYMLLSVILVVIPLSLSVVAPSALVTSPVSASRSLIPSLPRLFIILAPLALYFFLLSFIPIPVALTASSEPSFLNAALSRITVLGVLILGFLSGFGSVTTSWGYFPFVCGKKRKVPTQADVDLAEQSLERVRRDLKEKQDEISARERQHAEGAEPSKASSSWLSRVASTFQGDSELTNLETELSALISLEAHMSNQLQWTRQQRASTEYDETLKGQLFILGRRAMGIYCIFRGLSSLINILMPSTTAGPARSYPDLLTTVLVAIFAPPPAQAAQITTALRQANLVLVGAVIGASVRRVLSGVTHALRIASGALILLVLAQLMGTYLLSTLVQLRTSFPPPEDQESNVFSTLPEYQFFGPVFDWSFLLAATGAAAMQWARGVMSGGPDD